MDQKSQCKKGWLHRYRISRVFNEGVEEICDICKDRKFFKNNISNAVYLTSHQRQALSKDHNLFSHEYASTATTK
jgi:hypothetical protein